MWKSRCQRLTIRKKGNRNEGLDGHYTRFENIAILTEIFFTSYLTINLNVF